MSILLGLRAGAGEIGDAWAECLQDVCECAGPDPGSADECYVIDSEQEEPLIRVGDSLLAQFSKETNHHKNRKTKKMRRCPLCPFHELQKPSKVREHIQKYHTAAHSGPKLSRVCCALSHHDQIRGDRSGNYLRRSAGLFRSTIKPALFVSVWLL